MSNLLMIDNSGRLCTILLFVFGLSVAENPSQFLAPLVTRFYYVLQNGHVNVVQKTNVISKKTSF